MEARRCQGTSRQPDPVPADFDAQDEPGQWQLQGQGQCHRSSTVLQSQETEATEAGDALTSALMLRSVSPTNPMDSSGTSFCTSESCCEVQQQGGVKKPSASLARSLRKDSR